MRALADMTLAAKALAANGLAGPLLDARGGTAERR